MGAVPRHALTQSRGLVIFSFEPTTGGVLRYECYRDWVQATGEFALDRHSSLTRYSVSIRATRQVGSIGFYVWHKLYATDISVWETSGVLLARVNSGRKTNNWWYWIAEWRGYFKAAPDIVRLIARLFQSHERDIIHLCTPGAIALSYI